MILAAEQGRFDTFNPYAKTGVPAPGAELLYATLMMSPTLDPKSAYPYVAQSYEKTSTSITFTLNPKARFENGTQISAQDVVFSFNILKEKGASLYQRMLKECAVKALSNHKVEFQIKKGIATDELFFLIAKLPVFFAPDFKKASFNALTSRPLTSSGPYKILKNVPGKYVAYARVKGWWGESLPMNKGRYNFDTIKYLFFLDDDVRFEAFKKGLFHWRAEWRSGRWFRGYTWMDSQAGTLIKKEVPKPFHHGLNAIFFNTKTPFLRPPQLRQILRTLFDFESMNKKRMFGAYKQNFSIYMDPLYSRTGEEPTAQIMKLLQGIADKSHSSPIKPTEKITDIEELLSSFGYHFKQGKLRHKKTDAPLVLRLILDRPGTVRLLQPYQKTLKKWGIQLEIQLLEKGVFLERLQQKDYDMAVYFHAPMMHPGETLFQIWSKEGKRDYPFENLSQIQHPIIDALIEKITTASAWKDFHLAAQALDWCIEWLAPFIPMWFRDNLYVAYYDRFILPKDPKSHALIHTWGAKKAIEGC